MELNGILEFKTTNNIMLTKTNLKQQIDKFPEEFSIDELVERLIFIEKVERGNKQSLEGKVVSESDLDVEIGNWFK
ncbi:MAG: hypothetical protein L3J06_06945 [Cyclobacteriaceae bacterium]|nr:hypothetical protein [Cyclobacteriaceae bacterium]